MSRILEHFSMGDTKLIFPGIFISIIVLIVILAIVLALFDLAKVKDGRKIVERLLERGESLPDLEEHLAETSRGDRRGIRNDVAEAVGLASRLGAGREISDVVSHCAAKIEARFCAAFLRFSIAVVLIIGLAGTFVAFFELVERSEIGHEEGAGNEAKIIDPVNSSLEEKIGAEDGDGTEEDDSASSSLEESIPYIVAHLNLAFLASIAGVVGSVLLQLLNTVWVQPNRTRFYASLEKLLWHSASEISESGEDSEAAEGEKQTREDTLGEVASSLVSAASAMSDVSERLEAVGKSTPEQLGVTLEGLKKELEELPGRFEGLVDAAKETKTSVEAISTNASAAINTAIEEFSKKQTDALNQLESYKNELLKRIEANDEERKKHLSTEVSKLVENFLTIRNQWEKSAENLIKEFQNDRGAYISEIREERQRSLDAVKEAAKQAITEVREGYETQVEEWEKISELAKEQREAMAKSLEDFGSQRVKISKDLESLQEGAREALESANRAEAILSGAMEELEGRLVSIDTTMSGVGAVVGEAGEIFERSGVLVAEGVKDSGESVRQSLGEIAPELQELSKNIDRLGDRVDRRAVRLPNSLKRSVKKLAFWRRDG